MKRALYSTPQPRAWSLDCNTQDECSVLSVCFSVCLRCFATAHVSQPQRSFKALLEIQSTQATVVEKTCCMALFNFDIEYGPILAIANRAKIPGCSVHVPFCVHVGYLLDLVTFGLTHYVRTTIAKAIQLVLGCLYWSSLKYHFQ